MNMKTKHYQTELALLVGDDLPEADAAEVYRHLSTCPECRGHLQKLKKSQDRLSDYALSTSEVPSIDLRTRVQKSLPSAAQVERRHRLLHTWAPAATVVVACTLLFMVMGPEQSTAPVPGGSSSAHLRSARVNGDMLNRVTFDPEHFERMAAPNQEMQKGAIYRQPQLDMREQQQQSIPSFPSRQLD
ncbi:hypothetical protein Pla110_28960 [Polystyrenella longa]|uniref:Putative zinc-finger domain-containing protein n=1 Tax=Polystyrenella longa TaxID=2528007 RepID=A0A518CPK5_9PLAN|nr:zf-HC2 domain-containing protein [Polystyrenella longa]QDU81159.1 hypothetical protein Pla110_28960 [Polystyrenella longa]